MQRKVTFRILILGSLTLLAGLVVLPGLGAQTHTVLGEFATTST